MDYHSLPRKELQALCKKHNIAANLTNAQMADALSALLQEKANPKTKGKTSTKGSSADQVVLKEVAKPGKACTRSTKLTGALSDEPKDSVQDKAVDKGRLAGTKATAKDRTKVESVEECDKGFSIASDPKSTRNLRNLNKGNDSEDAALQITEEAKPGLSKRSTRARATSKATTQGEEVAVVKKSFCAQTKEELGVVIDLSDSDNEGEQQDTKQVENVAADKPGKRRQIRASRVSSRKESNGVTEVEEAKTVAVNKKDASASELKTQVPAGGTRKGIHKEQQPNATVPADVQEVKDAADALEQPKQAVRGRRRGEALAVSDPVEKTSNDSEQGTNPSEPAKHVVTRRSLKVAQEEAAVDSTEAGGKAGNPAVDSDNEDTGEIDQGTLITEVPKRIVPRRGRGVTEKQDGLTATACDGDNVVKEVNVIFPKRGRQVKGEGRRKETLDSVNAQEEKTAEDEDCKSQEKIASRRTRRGARRNDAMAHEAEEIEQNTQSPDVSKRVVTRRGQRTAEKGDGFEPTALEGENVVKDVTVSESSQYPKKGRQLKREEKREETSDSLNAQAKKTSEVVDCKSPEKIASRRTRRGARKNDATANETEKIYQNTLISEVPKRVVSRRGQRAAAKGDGFEPTASEGEYIVKEVSVSESSDYDKGICELQGEEKKEAALDSVSAQREKTSEDDACKSAEKVVFRRTRRGARKNDADALEVVEHENSLEGNSDLQNGEHEAEETLVSNVSSGGSSQPVKQVVTRRRLKGGMMEEDANKCNNRRAQEQTRHEDRLRTRTKEAQNKMNKNNGKLCGPSEFLVEVASRRTRKSGHHEGTMLSSVPQETENIVNNDIPAKSGRNKKGTKCNGDAAVSELEQGKDSGSKKRNGEEATEMDAAHLSRGNGLVQVDSSPVESDIGHGNEANVRGRTRNLKVKHSKANTAAARKSEISGTSNLAESRKTRNEPRKDEPESAASPHVSSTAASNDASINQECKSGSPGELDRVNLSDKTKQQVPALRRTSRKSIVKTVTFQIPEVAQEETPSLSVSKDVMVSDNSVPQSPEGSNKCRDNSTEDTLTEEKPENSNSSDNYQEACSDSVHVDIFISSADENLHVDVNASQEIESNCGVKAESFHVEPQLNQTLESFQTGEVQETDVAPSNAGFQFEEETEVQNKNMKLPIDSDDVGVNGKVSAADEISLTDGLAKPGCEEQDTSQCASVIEQESGPVVAGSVAVSDFLALPSEGLIMNEAEDIQNMLCNVDELEESDFVENDVFVREGNCQSNDSDLHTETLAEDDKSGELGQQLNDTPGLCVLKEELGEDEVADQSDEDGSAVLSSTDEESLAKDDSAEEPDDDGSAYSDELRKEEFVEDRKHDQSYGDASGYSHNTGDEHLDTRYNDFADEEDSSELNNSDEDEMLEESDAFEINGPAGGDKTEETAGITEIILRMQGLQLKASPAFKQRGNNRLAFNQEGFEVEQGETFQSEMLPSTTVAHDPHGDFVTGQNVESWDASAQYDCEKAEQYRHVSFDKDICYGADEIVSESSNMPQHVALPQEEQVSEVEVEFQDGATDEANEGTTDPVLLGELPVQTLKRESLDDVEELEMPAEGHCESYLNIYETSVTNIPIQCNSPVSQQGTPIPSVTSAYAEGNSPFLNLLFDDELNAEDGHPATDEYSHCLSGHAVNENEEMSPCLGKLFCIDEHVIQMNTPAQFNSNAEVGVVDESQKTESLSPAAEYVSESLETPLTTIRHGISSSDNKRSQERVTPRLNALLEYMDCYNPFEVLELLQGNSSLKMPPQNEEKQEGSKVEGPSHSNPAQKFENGKDAENCGYPQPQTNRVSKILLDDSLLTDVVRAETALPVENITFSDGNHSPLPKKTTCSSPVIHANATSSEPEPSKQNNNALEPKLKSVSYNSPCRSPCLSVLFAGDVTTSNSVEENISLSVDSCKMPESDQAGDSTPRRQSELPGCPSPQLISSIPQLTLSQPPNTLPEPSLIPAAQDTKKTQENVHRSSRLFERMGLLNSRLKEMERKLQKELPKQLPARAGGSAASKSHSKSQKYLLSEVSQTPGNKVAVGGSAKSSVSKLRKQFLESYKPMTHDSAKSAARAHKSTEKKPTKESESVGTPWKKPATAAGGGALASETSMKEKENQSRTAHKDSNTKEIPRRLALQCLATNKLLE